MSRFRVAVLIVAGGLMTLAVPGLADCVSCGPRQGIFTPFLDDLARKDALLAGAVWGGLAGDDSSPKADRSGRTSKDVKGTMRRDGRNYTYRTQVFPLSKNGVSMKIHLEEDGTGRGQDYEGIIRDAGRGGYFVRVGERVKSTVLSWDLP